MCVIVFLFWSFVQVLQILLMILVRGLKTYPKPKLILFLGLRALFCMFVVLFSQPLLAANIKCALFVQKSEQCYVALLEGEIVSGDYEKVISLYAKSHPLLGWFYLKSPGGNVSEAIQIGALLRKYFIPVRAPSWNPGASRFELTLGSKNICNGPNCICASACALIWFGAPERDGAVGLHRPHFASPTFKGLSPALASETYRPMIESVVKYLTEMEAPKSAIEAMVATSSAQVTWYNLENYSGDRAPSFAEWEDANCGAFGSDKTEWQARASLECLSGNAQACTLAKSLENERYKRIGCTVDLLRRHRSNLAAPSTGFFGSEYVSGINENQSRLVAPTGHLTFAKPENEPAPAPATGRLRFAPVQQGAPQ